MTEDVISMADMEAIFSVTDAYGIHREKVSVPLGKEDPGAVRRLPSGEVEIVVPEVAVHDWLSVLREGLEKLGFQRVGESQE